MAAFKVLAERVHPLALGDVARSREQIELLARKLLATHRQDKHSIDKIVSTLTKELGSHDYLISRNEARELLGDSVAPEDSELENLIWELYQDFSNEMSLGRIFDPPRELHAVKAGAQAQAAQLAACRIPGTKRRNSRRAQRASGASGAKSHSEPPPRRRRPRRLLPATVHRNWRRRRPQSRKRRSNRPRKLNRTLKLRRLMP